MGHDDDNFEQLLMGMIAGLMMRSEVRTTLREFELVPSEDRRALILHFLHSWNTYRIDVRFVANVERLENAVKAAQEGSGNDR